MKKIDYMGRRRDKYRERAVGVQYGVGSDEEDELLSDDDDATGKKLIHCVSNAKSANWNVRLARQKISGKRKCALHLAFETVPLVKNFCTERDKIATNVALAAEDLHESANKVRIIW